MFIRLIGRNLVTSSLFPLPGSVTVNSFFLFHLLGTTPLLRQPLYIAVRYLGKVSKAFLYIPPVIKFSTETFLFPKLPFTFIISILLKYWTSAVRVDSCDCSLARRWSSSSSLFLSVMWKVQECAVVCRLCPSFEFRRVSSVLLCVPLVLFLPTASLYTSF